MSFLLPEAVHWARHEWFGLLLRDRSEKDWGRPRHPRHKGFDMKISIGYSVKPWVLSRSVLTDHLQA